MGGGQIGLKELQTLLGISRQAVYAGIRRGKLPPAALRTEDGRVWWNRADIEACIAERKPAARLLAEREGAIPILVGADGALVGVSDLDGQVVTVYDEHQLAVLLKRRGMKDPGAFIRGLRESGPVFIRRN